MSVLATTASPRRHLALARHSATLAERSLRRVWRTPEALMDVVVQPPLFLLVFVYVFGGAVADSTHEYLQFFLPGVLGQTIALGVVSIGVNFNTDISKGVFDRFRAFPIPRAAPLIGAVLGDVVRYAAVAASTLAVGYLLGFRIQTDPLRALAGCLLAVVFALCLSWLSVLVGLVVRTPGAVQGALIPLLIPLAFASNVFVDPETFPGWMRTFAEVNPLSHLVGAIRGLFLGTPLQDHVWWTLGWCAVFVVVFMPLALRAYRRKA